MGTGVWVGIRKSLTMNRLAVRNGCGGPGRVDLAYIFSVDYCQKNVYIFLT
jgi:hypothetical protein